MESIIDDKIYELSTKEENFELVYDINQRFESIKERLRKEFWASLLIYLKNNSTNLIIRNEDDWLISLQDKKWNLFKINIEWGNDYVMNYGLYIEELKYKKQTRQVYKYLVKLDFLTDFNQDIYEDADGLCFYKYFSHDFTKLYSLKKLLPENRTDLFKELSQSLNELHKQIENNFIEIEERINNR
jgi:hypothetical protein